MKIYSCILVALLGPTFVLAAPPVDLSRFDSDRPIEQKAKALSEKDLMFADPVADKEEKPATNVRKIKTDTVARKGPREEAPAIFKLQPGEVVRITKFSKDKKWCIVQVISTGRRAWVHFDAIANAIPAKKMDPAQGKN